MPASFVDLDAVAQSSIRLIRLVCLYAILVYLGTEIALSLREIREAAPRSSAHEQADRLPSQAAGQTPFLGVTVALEQYDDPLHRQEALHRLSGAGFGWVRLRVDWNRVEPQPGTYKWTWTDDVLADISAAGMEPVVVLDGSPSWARDSRDLRGENEENSTHAPLLTSRSLQFAPPAAPETYARFVAAFADRYQDTVRFYQIWNEPNIAPHWGNRLIDPVGYARLLKAAAIAVRAADPDAVVLAAALAPTRIGVTPRSTKGIFCSGSTRPALRPFSMPCSCNRSALEPGRTMRAAALTCSTSGGRLGCGG